jgi:L-proline amide hydrolase
MRKTEGFIAFNGYKTYYKIVGNCKPGKLPLLCLHGGPGVPHDYLESFEDLAKAGHQVIFYDQLGCGKSDRPADDTIYSVKLYVRELAALRRALGLTRIHLLGQSWGGMLAMEYLLTKPKGVASVVIKSSPASMPLWLSEANRLRADLPPKVNATLLKHEQAGTTSSPAYAKAMRAFYNRHVCRVVPNPDYMLRAKTSIGRQYQVMIGPSEFHITGTLKTWDISKKIHVIKTPALFLSGIYDECTPVVAKQVVDALPNCRWVLFGASSHVCHVEERALTMKTIAAFLKEHA